MKVHHLNCGSLCPVGGHLMDGTTPGLLSSTLSCHCLLVETEKGLVLVDTGLSEQDVLQRERLAPFFRALCRPHITPEQTMRRQIEALGFKASDVQHILLTHLDFDHAGGIEDFPSAQVHVLDRELSAAQERNTLIAKGRYRPAQWDQNVNWNTYAAGGSEWFGFEAVRDLKGLPPELLLIPLIGHTWGHCGVAVHAESGWLFHAGDAYFYRDEMNIENPHCTPGLALYQDLMEVDRKSRLKNQDRLRALKKDVPEITLFSAHDHVEFEALREKSLAQRSPSREHSLGDLSRHV